MAPLTVLVTLLPLLSIPGCFQIPVAFGWWTSLRLALAGMFSLMASAHWGKRRPGLIRIVPKFASRPDLLPIVTGVLEILGAVGLMLPKLASYTAMGLALTLLAVPDHREVTLGSTAPLTGILDRRLMRIARLPLTVARAENV
jgi:uncharacterized membrane protein